MTKPFSSSVLAALALTLSALPLAPTHAVTIPDGTVPSNIGMQLKGGGDSAETLDEVSKLGVKWVRRGFHWEAIEKEKGVYDFSKFDVFVKDCKDRGLGIIGCMAFSNKLYGHVKDEPGRAGYAAYAAALAVRYKDENIMWEIWNEPNTMTFWGKHGKKGNSEPYAIEYTNLVKAVVPAMKAANPNCIVLAGSVSNMWTESYKWMGFCFKHGMLKQNWDAWSVHPYGLRSPEDYIEAYAITRKLMTDAGGTTTRPWINSERGFPIGKAEGFAGGPANMAYEFQAWHLVRQYLVDLLEGVRITVWYEWAGKEGFAFYRPSDPTPAYKACKVLIAELTGYKLDKRLPTKEPRDFVLRFTNASGGIKLVAWTAPPAMKGPDQTVAHAISLPVDATNSLNATALYGEKSTLTVKDGAVQIQLTGAPQYIPVKN